MLLIEDLFKDHPKPQQSEIHCQYCQCPKGLWKHSMKTYEGDECKLYDAFSDVIWELERAIKPFNNWDILDKCRKAFEHDYTDIKDFEACINEMIDIHLDLGVMPNNYRLLSVCK